MAQAIGKLNSITLAVSDMNRSVKFYRDILGGKVVKKTPGWSELKLGNFWIGMYEDKPKNASGGALPVLEVTNIKKTVADLKKKRVKFTEDLYEEDYGILVVFSDPDGYQYELFQEK